MPRMRIKARVKPASAGSHNWWKCSKVLSCFMAIIHTMLNTIVNTPRPGTAAWALTWGCRRKASVVKQKFASELGNAGGQAKACPTKASER